MENNPKLEKIYDLLERFDFHTLSDQEKSWVLSEMTEDEYTEMRHSMHSVSDFLKPDIKLSSTILHKKKTSGFKKLLAYPLELYKVAALIVLLISFYFIFGDYSQQQHVNALARIDTVFVNLKDTVFCKVHDTIKIKEYISVLPLAKTTIKEEHAIIEHSVANCNIELCPGEISRVIAFGNNNSIINDSTLKNMLMSMD